MLDRLVIDRDLLDANGNVVARRGLVVTPAGVQDSARRAPGGAPRIALAETALADDVRLPLQHPAYRHLFRVMAEPAVSRALLRARLPQALFDELLAFRRFDAVRYRHALVTAAVTARMLIAAVGDAPAISEMVGAALLHDLGMRHVPAHLVRNAGELDRREAQDIAAHPLLGALHIGSVLGIHPAVEAALAHHWKNGQGYPLLHRPPPRTVDVVAVASAFAALTQGRSFRPEPYDARGAVDVMVAEAGLGQRDPDTVRLLVHALRGARGEVRAVRFARARLGHAPSANRHRPIAPRVGTAAP